MLKLEANPESFCLCHSEFTWFVWMCLFQEEELERLEREFAIQSQITEAARRLASDPHVNSKKLKKQRKTSYLNALKKLQEIENSINEYRVRSGKKPTQRASLIIEGTNILLLSLYFYELWYHHTQQSSTHTLFRVFTFRFYNLQSLTYLFLFPIEANIGSEDSSLSDALVLDDGESLSFILLSKFIVIAG